MNLFAVASMMIDASDTPAAVLASFIFIVDYPEGATLETSRRNDSADRSAKPLPSEENVTDVLSYSTTERTIRDGWAAEWWTALCATTGLLSL